MMTTPTVNDSILIKIMRLSMTPGFQEKKTLSQENSHIFLLVRNQKLRNCFPSETFWAGFCTNSEK